MSVLGHNDADEYHKLMEAMKTLGFKDVELREEWLDLVIQNIVSIP